MKHPVHTGPVRDFKIDPVVEYERLMPFEQMHNQRYNTQLEAFQTAVAWFKVRNLLLAEIEIQADQTKREQESSPWNK